MLLQKSFKIKGPRLAKNTFPEISAWKNWIKISQHVLLLNLGVLKTLSAGFGGWGIAPLAYPLATALQCSMHISRTNCSKSNTPNIANREPVKANASGHREHVNVI